MREATWRQIGTDVTGEAQVVDVLERANLNYDVELRPIFMENGIKIPRAQVAVRSSDNHPYGVVSDRYEVVQNREAFDFVNYISDEVVFEKAGETATGMVYIIGRLPEKNILGDGFVPHVIFRNGFNGRFTISAAICPLRVVCENQFNFAFKHSANTVNIRHSKNANVKMVEARETLAMSYQYMSALDAFAEKYAAIKMNPVQVEGVIDKMFPMPIGDDITKKKENNVELAKERFLRAYNADDNWNFRGTAWGLINAFTDYKTHVISKTKKEEGFESKRIENKFAKTTFGRPMNPIIDAIEAVA